MANHLVIFMCVHALMVSYQQSQQLMVSLYLIKTRIKTQKHVEKYTTPGQPRGSDKPIVSTLLNLNFFKLKQAHRWCKSKEN